MEVKSINNYDYLSSLLQKPEKTGNQNYQSSFFKLAEQSAKTDSLKKDYTQELSEEDKSELQYLQKRDKEVREHERAHLSVAGRYAEGAANYSYEQGPDKKLYAVSGEVLLDVGKEGSPQKTIEKMIVIKRAALAPNTPSAQDRVVAGKAEALEQEAAGELRQERINDQKQNEDQRKKIGEGLTQSVINLLPLTYLTNLIPGKLINTRM